MSVCFVQPRLQTQSQEKGSVSLVCAVKTTDTITGKELCQFGLEVGMVTDTITEKEQCQFGLEVAMVRFLRYQYRIGLQDNND